MLGFIQNNAGTLIVGAVVLVIVAAVIVRLIKNKKSGGGCGSSCAGCNAAGDCGDRRSAN